MIIMKRLSTVLVILHTIEDTLLVLALAAMVLLSFGQVALRNLAHTGMVWSDSALRYLVLWLGFLGAMVATREDNHINIDILSHFLSGRAKAVARLLTDAFTAFICALLTYASSSFVSAEMESGTVAFGKIPAWLAEAVLPLAFGVIAFRYLVYFIMHTAELGRKKTRPQGEGV